MKAVMKNVWCLLKVASVLDGLCGLIVNDDLFTYCFVRKYTAIIFTINVHICI